jgi:anti-sigma factor RsiW
MTRGNVVELNDETLSAYLDNELAADVREQVVDALANDAGAKLRLERMRAANARLRSAMPLPREDHFHEAMVARIQGKAAPTRPAVYKRVIPWAMAAAISGMAVGFFGAQNSAPSMQIASNVAQALQQLPSGATSVDGTTKVILSFRSASTGYCRVFEAMGNTGGEGLACHDGKQWNIKAWDATKTSTEGFRTAGASSLIDGAMDALQGSDALDEKEEAAALSQRWSR